MANMLPDLRVTVQPWTTRLDSYVHLQKTHGLPGLLTKAGSSSARGTPILHFPRCPPPSSSFSLAPSLIPPGTNRRGTALPGRFHMYADYNKYPLAVRKL